MKYLLLLISPILVMGHSLALASFNEFEISTVSREKLPFGFDIKSERLPTGEVQFNVTVTEKREKFTRGDRLRGIEVHLEYLRSENEHWVRAIPFERRDGTVTCSFQLSRLECDDGDLLFGFCVQDGLYPHADLYYLPIKKFLMEAGSKPVQ
jgi:hypothetical protein